MHIARCVIVVALAACGSKDAAPPEPAADRVDKADKADKHGDGHGKQNGVHEDRHDKPAQPLHLALAVTIGTETAQWGDSAFADVPKLVGKASDGDARDTWSLRDLVHKNVGPTARVVAVVGGDGKKPIDEAAWADASKTPILHGTKRGALKFRWADKDGTWGDTVAKDVTGLEVVRQ